ncbi:MAG: hypothetical protein K6C30_04345 [Bacteroidaceae bacterium]|nr:hypothetical protein [Bacteroidaceae bacterium]
MKDEKDAKNRKGRFADKHEGWQPEVIHLSEEDLAENEALSKEFDAMFDESLGDMYSEAMNDPNSAIGKLVKGL